MCECERSIGLEDADFIINDEIKRLGFSSKVHPIGGSDFIQKCTIISSDNIVKSIGWGKGLSLNQSRVGAQFEALEHLVTSVDFNINLVKHKGITYSQVLENGYRVPNFYQFSWKSENINLKSHWSIYKNLSNKDDVIYVPTAMVDPDYRQSILMKNDELMQAMKPIVNNTGIAIGSNVEEAILHALNELSERFFFSQLLLHGFLLKKNIPIRKINSRKSELVSLIRQKFGVEVHLVDISFAPQYAVIAQTQGHYFPREIIGFGCSLNWECALSRAVSELLQMLEIVEQPVEREINIKEELHALESFEMWPDYQRVSRFNISKLTEDFQIFNNDENVYNLEVASYSVQEQINIITNAWKKRGISIYFREIYRSESGLSCVALIAPELGDFYLAYKRGFYVTPTQWQINNMIPY